MKKQSYDVPALDRALNILEYISDSSSPVTIKTISDDLNIPAASAFRLVKTLVGRGALLELNGGQPTYTFGPFISKLAYTSNKHISINSVSLPIMEELSKKTNQTSQLAVMNNQDFLYIEQVLPPVPVNFIAPLYTPIAVNYSAGAKIILANKPLDFQKEYLSSISMTPKTPNTLHTAESLLEDLKTSLDRGYALDDEEFSIGIGCLAVAIKDFKKECIGAIGLTGYIDQYKENQLDELIKEVTKAALDISKAFGYS